MSPDPLARKRSRSLVTILANAPWFLTALLCASSTTSAQGQGEYLNFETPQVEPITLATVNGDPYLLVCNTPDNRVEVYDLSTGTPVLETRILVGLEPASVTFATFQIGGQRRMMATANWLGDSVTLVELFSTTSGSDLTYRVIGTFPVNHNSASVLADRQLIADEPVHVQFFPSSTTPALVVAKHFGSSLSALDPLSGAFLNMPGSAGSVTGGGIDTVLTSSGAFPRQSDGNFPAGGFPVGAMALKEPHAVKIQADGRMWVIGFKGGIERTTDDSLFDFDFDLWSWQPLSPTTAPIVVPPPSSGSPGLGTTNFNLEFDAASGNTLYVVGAEARNDVAGNEALRNLPTGFVKTMLYKLDVSSLSSATITAGIQRRDLNLESNGQPTTTPIAHATDIAAYQANKVCVVGFNSDSFAIVDTTSSDPAAWTIERIKLPFAPGPNIMRGPRGLAVDAANHRAFLLNAIDNTLTVVNLSPLSLGATVAMSPSPWPDYIKRGKQFLHSTFGSGMPGAPTTPGFVSCASCHFDGRSDNLAWRLSTEDVGPFTTTAAGDTLGTEFGFEFNEELNPEAVGGDGGLTDAECDAFRARVDTLESNGFPHTPDDGNPGTIENAKGRMVTQSLQGLMNFEVRRESNLLNLLYQRFSNAPYHWRGDKHNFLSFNEAFEGLLGGVQIQAFLMREFEAYVNSIHYPPNAIQPIRRVYSGVLGNPNGAGTGSGGVGGLKMFHLFVSNGLPEGPGAIEGQGCGGRSCWHCHSLPVGSNNRWTQIEKDDFSIMGIPDDFGGQPLESTALRGLRQKEARLELEDNVLAALGLQTDLMTGNFGMAHMGEIGDSTAGFLRGFPALGTGPNANRINQFLREFDTGVAPMVGRTVTLFPADPGTWKATLIDAMEDQVRKGNCGLVALFYDQTSGSSTSTFTRGFWYSNRIVDGSNNPLYQEEGESEGAGHSLSRSDLQALLVESGDLLTFAATPLGSDRRIASLSGASERLTPAGTPSITSLSTIPNTANVPLLQITTNVDVSDVVEVPDDPTTVLWQDRDTATADQHFIPPVSLTAIRTLRDACIHHGLISGPVHHEAPRRLRLVGSNLVEGGHIRLGIDKKASTPPDSAVEADFHYLDLPIYPVRDADRNGLPDGSMVWETAVELDPTFLFILLLGGHKAPGVQAALNGDAVPPTTFVPGTWNKFRISYYVPGDAPPPFSAEVLLPLVY